MRKSTVELVVKPWYRQFYLRRGDADWASDQVSELGYAAQLEAIDGFVFIGTAMYGSPTRVIIEVHDGIPGEWDDSADRIVEESMHGHGDLAVLNWGDHLPVVTVEVPSGSIRIRASWFGLAEAARHPHAETGGTDSSPERLLIQVWAAPPAPRRVLHPQPPA